MKLHCKHPIVVLRRYATAIILMTLCYGICQHANAQGNPSSPLKIVLGTQYDIWEINSLSQVSITGHVTAKDVSTPEYSMRFSELSIGSRFPKLWHWTLSQLDISYYARGLDPRRGYWPGDDDEPEPLDCHKPSVYYDRMKATLLDIGYDNPLFRDYQWISFQYGKAVSSKARSWERYRDSGEFCVYSNIMAGGGISSFMADSTLTSQLSNPMYTGFEVKVESEITVRYSGLYFQPLFRIRYTIAAQPLSEIIGGVHFIYRYDKLEVTGQFERNWVSIAQHSKFTNHLRAALRWML